ncbi:sulfur carrier protein ThiS, partial [Brevibacterium paucivorans]
LNGAVIPRARWAETDVADGAVIDIVTAVQGG